MNYLDEDTVIQNDESLVHAPYTDAVYDALMADGLEPTTYLADDTDTGPGGETATLTAVYVWTGEDATEEFPYGLLVCWDMDNEWRYACLNEDGTNQPLEELPLSLWAKPDDVAACIAAIIVQDELPCQTGEWHDPEVKAAVRAWIES